MFAALFRKLIRPVLSAHDSAPAVAGGVAIGVGVALTPTVGIQMPIAWLIATLCGANRVVALALVWISNPFTVLPLYYSEYLLGTWLLDRPAVTSYNEFGSLWTTVTQMGYLEGLRELSDTVALPLIAGSFPPAVLLGSLAYPLALWWIRSYRSRRSSGTELEPDAAPPDEQRPTESGQRASRQVVAMLSGILLAGATACKDGNGPLSEPGVPVESEADGVLTVWSASLPGDVLLVLSPYHPSAQRNRFTHLRFKELLGAGETHRFLALTFYRFSGSGDPQALSLGRDGIPVIGSTSSGRIRSRRPSEFSLPEQEHEMLASLLGVGELPALSGGQMLRLLCVMPAGESLEEFESIEVELPGRVVALTAGHMDAVRFLSFQEEPRRDRFEEFVEPVDEVSSTASDPGDSRSS